MGVIRDAFNKIRETLVQEDNPNSPHTVFERMNKNMLGDSDSHNRQEKTVNKDKEFIMSTEQFEKIVWGDDEN